MNLPKVFRQGIATMASPTPAHISPFAKVVVNAMRKIYPEKLADSSFDNTGLLLEAPYRPGYLKNEVLLTIDLTKAVADEAIARKSSIVVAYHPIIFRGLKSLTLANTQQSSLLRLAQEGISVYCPHTAVDASPGGLNDWLADIVAGGHWNALEGPLPAKAAHTRSNITNISSPPEGFESAGYGRILRFQEPQTLGRIIARITSGLGVPNGSLCVATPQAVPRGKKPEIQISSVGLCAGSGGSMLGGLDVDLLFTGELSHHEALAAVEQGRCVITAFHSNTERGFLKVRMQERLSDAIKVEVLDMANLPKWEYTDGTDEFEVVVSDVDRDPYEVFTDVTDAW